MVVFAAIVIAALLQSSAAQTTYTVGDTAGWAIPTGASFYSNWAATNKSFAVGDILVFNFAAGIHDVAKVSKADYDACTTTSPMMLATTSPARVTLNSSGEHYFICNFTGHCSAGQKVMVNVLDATTPSPAPQPSSPAPRPSSPAPQPSSPAPQPGARTPVAAPSPAPVSGPSTAPVPAGVPSAAPAPGTTSPGTYRVGDSLGWTVPTTGATEYQTWASDKTFVVGDVLVFNYPSGAHNVAEVTSQAYTSCSTSNPISLESTPPTRITLASPGEHFYICAVPGHCTAGQKLSINVTGANSPGSSTPSSPSPPGVSAPPPPNNSATSLGVAGLSAATFLSIFVALLF